MEDCDLSNGTNTNDPWPWRSL